MLEPAKVVRAASLALAAMCCACTSASSPVLAGQDGQHSAVIMVGSFDFPESALLADMYGGAPAGVAIPVAAFRFFTPNEAFPRDLLAEFRKLAPQRRPIVLQRWSARRVGLAAGMLAVVALATVVGGGAFSPAQDLGAYPPDCGTGHTMILAAQAVPSAAFLPCIATLPSGWKAGGADIGSGRASFWLDSDQAEAGR